MSFSALKKKRGDFESLKSKIAPQNNNSNDNYYPSTDAAGDGYARIRFLPGKDGETHLVNYSKFNVKNKKGNKTYSHKNRKSMGRDYEDPFSEYLGALWSKFESTKDEKYKKIYSAQKMKRMNVCYVYVIEDKINPEENGKIKKFYMPASIKDKIVSAIDPDDKYDEDVTAFDPFDIYEGEKGGRDFIIRIKNKDDYRNYDDSKFAEKSTQWLDDEKEMEELWEEHVEDLSDILKEDSFPSYEKALQSLLEVFGSEKSITGDIVRDLFGDEMKDQGTKKAAKASADEDENDDSSDSKEEKSSNEEKKKSVDDDDFDIDDDDFDLDDFDD